MKKLSLLIVTLYSLSLVAQQDNVGINTANPTSRLEIKSNGNTLSTLALRMQNSSNTDIFKLYDNGYLGINTTPSAVVDVFGSTQGYDLFIEKPTNATSFNGTSTKPSFRHFRYYSGGGLNNANYGGQLMIFDTGSSLANNVVTHGIYIHPDKPSVPAGLYIGSDRLNGFSLQRLPTTDLDVGGSIRLREYTEAVEEAGTCTNRQGEIVYYKGHFYGCNRTSTWRKLDN